VPNKLCIHVVFCLFRKIMVFCQVTKLFAEAKTTVALYSLSQEPHHLARVFNRLLHRWFSIPDLVNRDEPKHTK
jgi:hypothetical protein